MSKDRNNGRSWTKSIAKITRATVATMIMAGSAFVVPFSVYAQETKIEMVEVEEIVVTAQKREQALADVPVAVTVLSGDALNEQQVSDVIDLTQVVPSITWTPGINDLISSLRIRGVGTVLFNQGLESSVAYVVDGVPLARQAQGFQDLIDIERVEVLRGPQGMLFGKNATAGLINVVTQRPSDDFGFTGDVTIAELNEYRFRGSVTGPLGEIVSGRMTGFYNDVGGHIENIATGDNVNGAQSYGGRLQLEAEVSPDLTFLFTTDYRKSEQECCQWQAVRVDNPLYADLLSPVVPSSENRYINTNADIFNDTEQWGASLKADWDTDIGKLTSISAYRGWEFVANNDVDSVFTAPPLYGLPFNFGAFDINRSESELKQFSEELRFASHEGGVFNYVLGLYYLHVDVDRAFTRRVGLCPPDSPANAGLSPGETCNAASFLSRLSIANSKNDNYAAFGQLDWNFTDTLTLISGFRLQHDRVSYSGFRPAAPAPDYSNDGVLGPTFIGGSTANSGSGSTSDTDLSGRLGLQYAFSPNSQSYFTYTRGYKGPGFDIEPTTDFLDQTPVRPETVDAYEIGFKASALDGALGLNIALFYQEYDDLQVQASIETGGLRAFVPTNAGRAETKGIEIEVFARPSPNFVVTAGLTALDTSVDVDGLRCLPGSSVIEVPDGEATPGNSCFRFTSDAATATRQNIRDGRLPNAPRFRGSVTARYDDVVEGLGMRMFAQTTARYQSEVSYSLEQNPLLIQDGYPLVDVSFGVGDPDGWKTLTFFVKNVFDKNYYSVLLLAPTWESSATTANINGFFPKESERYIGANLRVSF